jgi:tRNA pseudouridine55 synthase
MPHPVFPDGVLVVDKPCGPTSHDIVAVARRAIRRSASARTQQIKVGHTGTLDPLASGVLPLVLGKATRLAQFLPSDKEYEAKIELGISTTTLDRAGEVLHRDPSFNASALTLGAIENALADFRGTYLQQPPAFSAKKVGGDRAYDLARKQTPIALAPVRVTVSELEILEWRERQLKLRLVCSAGYYVRSLAEALGRRLGTGAHLAALVRTRSGDFRLAETVTIDELDRRPEEAATRVIPIASLLGSIPALTLNERGAALASRGGFIGPSHIGAGQPLPAAGRVRLLRPDGRLIAIARAGAARAGDAGGLLHPDVVLE